MTDLVEIIKYCDIFGSKSNFYSDKKPKLYSVLGGILSILTLFICIVIFVFFSLDDFNRTTPTTTSSSIPSNGYHKIKFGEEKIWLPWRIVDYHNRNINHTGVIFPVIYYYYGDRKEINETFELKSKILSYKLCNETSMKDLSDIYHFDIPLDNLYCINMDDLDMGGSWVTEYIYYIKFDLYLCKNGIDFDINNKDCSSFEKVTNLTGKNNSLEFDLYYPVVQFQPTNIKNPIIVIYRQYYYHISKFSYKIDRLFLQEHILNDDLGWFGKKNKNFTFWGLSNIGGDHYSKSNTYEKDFLAEGSTSRLYSVNVYLEPGIIYYTRSYKKFYKILADFLPVVYFVFIVFRNITKIFKLAEQNKKYIELLFENLKEKKKIINSKMLRPTDSKINVRNNIKIVNKNNHKSTNIKAKKIEDTINHINFDVRPEKKISLPNKIKNITDSKILINTGSLSDLNMNKQKDNFQGLSVFYTHNNESNNNIINNIDNNEIKYENSLFSLKRRSKLIFERKMNDNKKDEKNIFRGGEEGNKNEWISISKKGGNHFSGDENISKIFYTDISRIQNTLRKKIISEKLFPYKYYLCTIFLKNIDINRHRKLLSLKFRGVYQFLSELIDMSSYLHIQREFNIMKNLLFPSDKIKIIEDDKKININSRGILRDLKENDKEVQKFKIFSKNIEKKEG